MFGKLNSQDLFGSNNLDGMLSRLVGSLEWASLMSHLEEARKDGKSPKLAVLEWLLLQEAIKEIAENGMGDLLGALGNDNMGDSPFDMFSMMMDDDSEADDTVKVKALQNLLSDLHKAQQDETPEHDLPYYIEAFGFNENGTGILFARRFMTTGAMSTLGDLMEQIEKLTVQVENGGAYYLYDGEQQMLKILIGLLNAHAEAGGLACPFAVEHGDRVLSCELADCLTDKAKAMLDAARE